MLTSGDIVAVDSGEPVGREVGFPRPAIVVTAQVVLAQRPSVVHVVPLTGTQRGFRAEVDVEPDPTNGLGQPSAAQCQHVRAVSVARIGEPLGHAGPTVLAQIQETIADLIDL